MEENVKVVENEKKFFKKPAFKKPAFKKPNKDFGKGALLGTVAGGLVGFIGRGFLDSRIREDNDEFDADESEIDAEDEDE